MIPYMTMMALKGLSRTCIWSIVPRVSLVIISGGGYSVSSADQSAESELYQTSKVSQPALRHNDKVV